MRYSQVIKQNLIKDWGRDELHRGKSYAEVIVGTQKLNLLTLEEVEEFIARQEETL